MKCPYCGAELQENARFCLYCMKSLQDKRQIEVPRAKKKWRWFVPIAVATAIAAALFLLLRREAPAATGSASTQPSENRAVSAVTEAASTQLSENRELPPITDPNTFYFNAVSWSKKLEINALWEPASMWFPEETRAVVPLSMQDADCQVLFLQDGRAILAEITNLTDDTLADGQRIAACIGAAVYDGIADLPALHADLPTVQAERSVLDLLGIDDPAQAGTVTAVVQCRLEPKSYGGGQQYLRYELRTRSCEDGTYYDIFLYFGQE